MNKHYGNGLYFHIHSEISELKLLYDIPMAFIVGTEVYITQQDRIVFIGRRKGAEQFIKIHYGKRIDQLPYVKEREQEDKG